MRSFWFGIGLAGLFAAGCSSTTTEDGGTSSTGGTTGQATTTTSSSTGGTTTGTTTTAGTSSTTGATTTGGTTTGGTTTGGTTTGGTTTGGTTGLADGAACTANGQCQSAVCGINGSGNCCSAACSTSDVTCGASACDNTGACTYPVGGSACGTDACSGNMLITNACDGSGTCVVHSPAACPGNLICADTMTCKTTCAVTADCDTGFVCSNGSCVTPLVPGAACTANEVCASGVCGASGSGHCCSAACTSVTAPCGASDCDATGACIFPDKTVSCGPAGSCTGSTQTNPTVCDGLGNCPPPGTTDCTPFICGTTACLTSCTDNTSCQSGDFCDTGASACCAGIASGSGLLVDNTNGSDKTACCGYGSAGACQTLTRAMQLVNGTNTVNPGTLVTLNASVGGAGGDWTTETTPVSLGWGVTLSAPGIYFTDIAGNAEIFDVALQTGETAPANPVIIGVPSVNAGDQVVIGSDSQANLTSDPISINVENGQTLDLLNAQVLEAANTFVCVIFPCGIAVDVQNGAALNVGFDSNANSGTAYLGGTLPNGNAPSYGFLASPSTGILCNGTVADSPTGATPSLVSQSEAVSIDAEDGCSVALANDPTFGTPTSGGYSGNGAGCATIADNTGILANGNASTVTLSGATISCMSSWGVQVTNSNSGMIAPVVTLQADGNGNASVIENCSSAGVYASAGTTYLIGATVTHNFVGVDLETDPNTGSNPDAFWLNDGTGTAPTTNTSVVCSSNQENGSGNPGMDVFNNSTATVNADYVSWDQWYDPNGGATATTTDVFYCDNTPTCTCEVFDSTSTAACKTPAGNDDMDLVLGTQGNTTPSGAFSANSGASAGSGCP